MDKSTGSRNPRRRTSTHPKKRPASVAELRKGAILQRSDPRRFFKGLGVAKWYCSIDSIGDTFVQRAAAAQRLGSSSDSG